MAALSILSSDIDLSKKILETAQILIQSEQHRHYTTDIVQRVNRMKQEVELLHALASIIAIKNMKLAASIRTLESDLRGRIRDIDHKKHATPKDAKQRDLLLRELDQSRRFHANLHGDVTTLRRTHKNRIRNSVEHIATAYHRS
ncbi:hypothetical protein J4464_07075 [Candidatus Woesearchaeota archaeon]|nr:hypothetical protein [Candidatus Woesearchaeota archaeon]